jgi:hypothetical protein
MRHLGFLAVLAAIVLSAVCYAPPKPAHAAPAVGIVAESLTITDMAGKGQLRAVKPGGQFMAMLAATNAAEGIQEYVAVFEVRDANGFTVFLDFSKGLLNPGQTSRIGLPVLLQENTYFPAYDPQYFSFAVKNVPALDAAYVGEASGYVSFLYLTDDVESLSDPNPYNTLPRYFAELLDLLDPSLERDKLQAGTFPT